MARRQPSAPERRIHDRRLQAMYNEPDRRERERRANWPKPKPRELKDRRPLVLVALIALILVDSLVWHGYYAHAVMSTLNSSADGSRSFTDNMWK